MDARLTLRPGAVPGEVVGEVTVTRTPVIFDFNAQNFGSGDVGRWGGNARARFAGLTGMGDLTTLRFYVTPDFDVQQLVQIGRAHVCTPVTNEQLVCRLLLEKTHAI